MRSILLAALGLMFRDALCACEPYCEMAECTELNGDVTRECGDCKDQTYACRPGAKGYDPAENLHGCGQYQRFPVCPHGRWGQSTHQYANADNANTADIHSKTISKPNVDCLNPKARAALKSDCSNPESVELFAQRGWVVIRGLAPQEELAKIVAERKVENLCQPVKTGTEEGRKACAFSSAAFRQQLPGLTANIGKTLEGWEESGVAAAAQLGTGLRLPQEHERVSRLIHITSDKTFARLQKEHGLEAKARYLANWHVDNQGSNGSFNPHWLLLMVHKQQGTSEQVRVEKHANLCVVPTTSVDQCDTPEARQQALDDRKLWTDLWEKLSCCPDLQPGDAVFYREDVAHRTQDQLIDRLSMVITIHPNQPENPPSQLDTTTDAKCPSWAAHGYCESARTFMDCVCGGMCKHAQSHSEL